VPALQAQVIDVGASGLRGPQPVQREQRDQRMLGRRRSLSWSPSSPPTAPPTSPPASTWQTAATFPLSERRIRGTGLAQAAARSLSKPVHTLRPSPAPPARDVSRTCCASCSSTQIRAIIANFFDPICGDDHSYITRYGGPEVWAPTGRRCGRLWFPVQGSASVSAGVPGWCRPGRPGLLFGGDPGWTCGGGRGPWRRGQRGGSSATAVRWYPGYGLLSVLAGQPGLRGGAGQRRPRLLPP
jgi:hypothetical protein